MPVRYVWVHRSAYSASPSSTSGLSSGQAQKISDHPHHSQKASSSGTMRCQSWKVISRLPSGSGESNPHGSISSATGVLSSQLYQRDASTYSGNPSLLAWSLSCFRGIRGRRGQLARGKSCTRIRYNPHGRKDRRREAPSTLSAQRSEEHTSEL